MQLEYFNCPQPQELDPHGLAQNPEFLAYIPDFERIRKTTESYQQYPNILVIGHGGSITSFYAMYQALRGQASKRAYFLNTVDPDYIHELQHKLSPADTLVIAISKSGETTTQIEALAQFLDYPLLLVTEKHSSLAAIAQKLEAELVKHPPIGGRFTAFTEVALLPAAICGFDIEALYRGGRDWQEMYQRDNSAWKAASILWQLEQRGYVDVFLPVYSHNLFASENLITQLCHESFGKAGRGQTYFAAEAPESQHHTNQRFFGGQKNVAGFAISLNHYTHQLNTVIPPRLHGIPFKNQTLATLNKVPLQEVMRFELQGVLEDARVRTIPILHLSLSQLNEQELGRFIAFWQLYAVYGAILRRVDPFDQPEVEASKRISFDKRLQYRGLL